MRDLVVREALVAMAQDAAACMHELVRKGEEVPYEVREPGDGSPLCRYEPQSERFIRDHVGELRRLDSFGAGCAALEAAGLAGRYLDAMGLAAPSEPRQRAELAGLVFLCRLWMDSLDFKLDDARLDGVIEELQHQGEAERDQIEVVVPLRGMQMPVARLDLATASIVRSDTVEVPPEARSSDGLGVSPWEPAFLAVARIDEDREEVDRGAAAVHALRTLVTTLRLFKSGGVGLGPHAWARGGGDRWRRVATGVGRPRPGGYRLTESELGDLVALSRALTSQSAPFGRRPEGRGGFPAILARAVARFEAGLERNVVIEALSDHLLALRFLLEGAGPADLGVPMRVAALCAEPVRRPAVKAVVDRAIGLERELWSGEPAPAAGSMTPAETASQLEGLLRAILSDAAVGHLGHDLRTTADEILLADGFALGDGAAEQRGGTTEWDLEPVADADGADSESADEAQDPDPVDEAPGVEIADESLDPDGTNESLDLDGTDVPDLDAADAETGVHRAEPGLEPEGADADFADADEGGVDADSDGDPVVDHDLRADLDTSSSSVGGGGGSFVESDWGDELDWVALEVSELDRRISPEGSPETVEVEMSASPEPASTDSDYRPDAVERPSPVLRLIEQTRAESRARQDRISGLFPRPETTEWNVREIGYDRRRRARGVRVP